MPATELCVIHPGALSASCWARLASHLPAGTPVKVLELETINAYWADDPTLTVDALADRLRGRLDPPRRARVLVGWGVGGVVADALAALAPPRRVVVLDGAAPGAPDAEPTEAELLRSFAMYVGARKRPHAAVVPERLTLEPRSLEAASRAPARCARTRRRRRSSAASRSTPPASCATTA